jgi:hypothetical protein
MRFWKWNEREMTNWQYAIVTLWQVAYCKLPMLNKRITPLEVAVQFQGEIENCIVQYNYLNTVTLGCI